MSNDVIRTTQSAFTPLDGHVADGTEITMRDGVTWMIKAAIAGWELIDHRGIRQIWGTRDQDNSASVIAAY